MIAPKADLKKYIYTKIITSEKEIVTSWVMISCLPSITRPVPCWPTFISSSLTSVWCRNLMFPEHMMLVSHMWNCNIRCGIVPTNVCLPYSTKTSLRKGFFFFFFPFSIWVLGTASWVLVSYWLSSKVSSTSYSLGKFLTLSVLSILQW